MTGRNTSADLEWFAVVPSFSNPVKHNSGFLFSCVHLDENSGDL